MTLNVQDTGRGYWENSPSMDIRDPSSVTSLPYHPAKSMCLETELGSSRREQHLHPVSVAQLSPPGAQSMEPAGLETPDASPVSAEFSQVDLGDWHPRYLACMQHFLDQGQHSPAVQSLAAFINIYLPCQRLANPIMRFTGTHAGSFPNNASSYVPLRPYIRRLIVTGQDVSNVLEAFFGDDWLGGVGGICKQERLNYLFTAKSGGWASTKAAYDILPDEHAPFLRPLREPSEEELRIADSRWSEWLAMEDWMVGPRSPW